MQPFALAAGGGRVYSASNDGGVRVWGEDGSKVTELTIAGPDVGTLRIFGGELYAGDEGGNVRACFGFLISRRNNLGYDMDLKPTTDLIQPYWERSDTRNWLPLANIKADVIKERDICY